MCLGWRGVGDGVGGVVVGAGCVLGLEQIGRGLGGVQVLN